jgi:molecular chaperone GrpE
MGKPIDNENNNPEPEVEILSSSPESQDESFTVGKTREKQEGSSSANPEAEEWKNKHDEIKDKFLWLAADFDNYKKRALKEKDEFLKFSNAGLIREFLVVADNLERAMGSLPSDDMDEGLLKLKQGVELTLRQFKSLLDKQGVTKIAALGEKFDPKFHEVMFLEETDQFPEGTVMEELQSGYLLHERVLRPALVKVAKAKKSVESPSP